jgi:SAM-dependent methyltransferase
MNELNKIKETFFKIYSKNAWGNGSGDGSHPNAVVDYCQVLTDTIKTYNIKSVLDYGCGDWQFSKLIDWENLVDSYTGVDVIDTLIQHHTQHYVTNKIKFQTVTENFEFPKVDLIICKDVLQHLPNNIVSKLLNSFESSSTYMLITNDANIDASISLQDCNMGGWHPLNLTNNPWNKCGTISLKWYPMPEYSTIKETILIQNF